MQIWFLFSLRTIDQIKCELWRRKMILCYQEVHLLSGCGVGKEAKVRTSFFSWAIFFFNSILSFKHPPPHHYPPPHFLAEKGNWFKNISSALLKVWLHARYSGAIQCACRRFSNLGHQNHFSILLFESKISICVSVCMCLYVWCHSISETKSVATRQF